MTVLAGKTAGQTSWLDCAATPCFPCSEQLSLEAGQHRGGPLSSALCLFISLFSCSLVLPVSHSDWCYWDKRVAEIANRPLKWKTNLRKQAWMDFHGALLIYISSPPLSFVQEREALRGLTLENAPSCLFQTCMTDFHLWSTNEGISNNVGM